MSHGFHNGPKLCHKLGSKCSSIGDFVGCLCSRTVTPYTEGDSQGTEKSPQAPDRAWLTAEQSTVSGRGIHRGRNVSQSITPEKKGEEQNGGRVDTSGPT